MARGRCPAMKSNSNGLASWQISWQGLTVCQPTCVVASQDTQSAFLWRFALPSGQSLAATGAWLCQAVLLCGMVLSRCSM